MPSNDNIQNLFLRSSSAWQFGDWKYLSLINIDEIRLEKDCDVLFGMHINSLLQLGLIQDARDKILKCSEYGISLDVVKRFIVSSAYNTLANFQVLNSVDFDHTASLYSKSVQLGMPAIASELAFESRTQYQRKLLIDDSKIEVPDALLTNSIKAGALYFINGESRPLKIPESEDMDFTKDFTIQFLLRLHSWPLAWTQIISKFSSDKHNEFCFRIKDADLGQFFYGDGHQVCAVMNWSPKDFMQLGKWATVALVKSSHNILRLYFDGVLCAERDISGMFDPVATNSPVCVMGGASSSICAEGDIADVRVSKMAKSTEQIYSEISSYDENDHLLFKVVNEEQGVKSGSGYLVFPTNKICIDNITNEQKVMLSEAAKAVSGLDYQQMIKNLGRERQLNIVVVGANDGKINDPLFPLMIADTSLAKLLLIEPQADLIPYLTDNYHFHPDVTVVNAAIGPESELILYSIKKELWAELNIPYARERNWPLYRAPTGVTSSSKDHVKAWLRKHVERADIESFICENVSPCFYLDDICRQNGFYEEIDVLQIDTEGFDDQVIYSSALEVTKPKLIHFESAHLPGSRAEALQGYLQRCGYRLHRVGENSLAVLEHNNS